MSEIKWHPFPQEKPKRKKLFLITVKDSDAEDSKMRVVCARWEKKSQRFWGHADWTVVAWRKFPKPFQPHRQKLQ